MPFYKQFLWWIIWCSAPTALFAQASNFGSPYSRFALGEQQPFSLGTQRAMGGVTTAWYDSVSLNLANPASLSALRLTSIEFGAFGNVSRLQTNTASQYRSHLNFGYLMMGFPVNKRWGTAVGFQPFAFTNYNIVSQVDSSFASWREEYQGKGGINQLTWSNGFDLGKGFSAGVNLNMLFGEILQERRFVYPRPDSLFFLNLRTTDRVRLGDAQLSLGVQYRKLLPQRVSGKYRQSITLGLTADVPTNLRASNDFVAERYTLVGSRLIVSDTVQNLSGNVGQIKMPLSLSFGAQYSLDNFFLANLEARYQQWSQFSMFDRPDSLLNSLHFAGGFQYIPKYNAMGDGAWYKTMRYRVGFRHHSGNLSIKGNAISETGMTFGLGIPVKRQFSMPFVNLGVELGQRGSLNNGLVRERYTRVVLGLTLNDRWFVKRKYD